MKLSLLKSSSVLALMSLAGMGAAASAFAQNVSNSGYYLNGYGNTLNGSLYNTGSATNSGTITGAFNNSGTGAAANFGTVEGGANNSATASYGLAYANFGTIDGGVVNSGSFGGNGTVNGGFQNTGIVDAQGTINGAIVNSGSGVFTIGTLVGDDSFTNTGTAVLNVTQGNYTGLTSLSNTSTAAVGVEVDKTLDVSGAVSNGAGATIQVGNGGLLSADNLGNAIGGTVNVEAGGTADSLLTNSGQVTNNGTWTGDVSNGDPVYFGATLTNNGTWTGNLSQNVDGTATNAAGATWTGTLINAGTFYNYGTWTGAIVNSGSAGNSGYVLNGEGATVSGLVTTQANGVTFNAGAMTGGVEVDGGYFETDGTVNGGLTNSGNTTVYAGAINGAIYNQSGGTFTVSGPATSDSTSTFLNLSGGSVEIANGGAYTLDTALGNAGTLTVDAGGTLGATDVVNETTGTIQVAAGGTVNGELGWNANSVTNNGTWNGYLDNAAAPVSGSVINYGAWNGDATNGNDGFIINETGATWTGSLGTSSQVVNAGTWVGDAGITSTGILINYGTWTGAINNNGEFGNASGATVSGLVSLSGDNQFTYNAGTLNGGVLITDGVLETAGTVNGGIDNQSTGLVLADGGAINGTITNEAGGDFVVDGTVTSDSGFGNGTGGYLEVTNGGNYAITGTLLNNNVVTVDAGGALSANNLTNYGTLSVGVYATFAATTDNTGYIANQGTITGDIASDGASTAQGVDNWGTWNGNVTANTGQSLINNWGTWTGTLNNSAYVENGPGATWTGDVTNTASGEIENDGTWAGNLTNSGYVVNGSGGVWTGDAGNAAGGTILNEGTWNGFIDGGLTNAGTVNATSGTITGAVVNQWGGLFSIATGQSVTTAAASSFDNQAGGELYVGGSFTTIGQLTNEGDITVDVGGSVSDTAGITLGAGATIDNWGTWTGAVTTAGGFANEDGATLNGLLTETGGSVFNAGTMNGGVVLATDGYLLTGGTINGGLTNSGVINAANGEVNGAIVNQSGGQFYEQGGVTSDSTFTNQSGATLDVFGGYTVAGVLSNAGTVAVATSGVFTDTAGTSNSGGIEVNPGGAWTGDVATIGGGSVINYGTWTGNATNAALASLNNGGTWTGAINNAGTFENQTGGTVSGLVTNSGSASNAGTLNGGLDNTGTGAAANFGTINGGATNSAVTTTGAALANFGTINGGVVNSAGTFGNVGTVNGGLQNTAIVDAQGTVNGAIVNSGAGVFTTTGALTGDGSFTNSGTAVLNVSDGDFTGLTALANSSTATNGIAVLQTLAISGTVSNGAGAEIHVGDGGLLTAGSVSNAGILVVDAGGSVVDSLSNSGTVSNSGTYTADVNNSGAAANLTNQAGAVWAGNLLSNTAGATVTNAGHWTGTASNAANLNNAAGATWTGSATNLAGGALSNAGTWTGTVSNAGTFVNAAGGTLSGLLTQTAGTTTNAGTLNGGVVIAGGTLTTTGTINGGLSNAGTVNAAGTIDGTVTNTGTFNITGPLTLGSAAFANTGTLSVGTASATGAFGVQTLTNNGLLTMQNGQAGDKVTVAGAYTGAAGSSVALDVNLATGQADRLAVGTLNGTTTLSLAAVGGARNYFSAPIVLVTSGGGSGTVTAGTDAQTQAVMSPNSLVDYHLAKLSDGTDWGLISTINGAVASTVGSDTALFMNTMTSDLHPATDDLVVARGAEGWSGHVWMRASYASARMDATTTSNDGYSAAVGTTARLDADSTTAGAELQRSTAHTSLQLGVMAGWTGAQAHDGDGAADTRFNVPTAGAYAVFSAPHVLVGVEAYHDELSIRPDAQVSDGTVHGHGDTVALSAALPVTAGIFTFAPYADYRASNVRVDGLTVLGGTGSLAFGGLSGNTAGAGLRLSASSVSHGVRLKPYASIGVETVSGHREQTIFTPSDGGAAIDLATTGPGNYTRASAGVEAQFQSGWSAYGQLDGRTGSALNGLSLTAGARLKF